MAKDKDKDKDLELRFLEETESEGFSSNVSSLTSQIQKNRKKERMQQDVLKSISSIAKQQEQTQRLIHQRELGYTKGVVEIERSANKLLQKLGLTVDTMTRSARKILVTTAQTTKDLISDMSRTMNQDFQVNKSNTVGMAIAASTPIFGYFAAKFMETSVFQDFKERIKSKLGEVFTFAGDKFKKAIGNMRGKKFSEILDMAGKGLVEFLKLPFKLIGSSFRALWEGTKFLLKLPFKALGLAFAGVLKVTKFILTLPFKAIGVAFKTILLPFKMIKGMFGAIRQGYNFEYGKGGKRSDMIPSAQSGGYVKKGGLVNVHAGEVIAPISSIFKDLEKKITKFFKVSKIGTIPQEIVKLRVALVGVGNEFTASLFEKLTRGPIARKLLKVWNIFETVQGVIHWVTRPRGRYTRQIPRGPSPLQNMQTILGMAYANGMSKLDQLIRLLGGNPEDDSTRAGSYLDQGMGIWGALKKKKIELLGDGGTKLLTSGVFKSSASVKRVQDGILSFFGFSFYKSWKKQNKIENEATENQEDKLKNIAESSKRIRENSDKDQKSRKGLMGWAKYILLWAFGTVKSLASGALKGLGIAIMGMAQGISWLSKAGAFKFIGQGVKVLIPLLGTFIGVMVKFLTFSMKVLAPIAGLMVGTGMTLTDMIRGRWNAKETFGKQKGEKLSTSEKLTSIIGAALGGVHGGAKGAKWGAVKGAALGAAAGSFIPVIGTAIGGVIGAIAGGIMGAIGGKSITMGLQFVWNEMKFGIEVVWNFIKWPFNILLQTVGKAKDWLTGQLKTFNEWMMNQPIIKSVVNWVQTEVMPAFDKYVKPVFSFIQKIWSYTLMPFKAIAGIFKYAKDFFADSEGRERSMKEALASQKKRHEGVRGQVKEITSVGPTKNQIMGPHPNMPLMDNGGFVGGAGHKAIMAHRDEYVVDPTLSRSLRATAQSRGVSPKSLIRKGLGGGISDNVFQDAIGRFESKFTEISNAISGSIIKGFQMIIDAFTKQTLADKLGFGGGISSFAGNMISKIPQVIKTGGNLIAKGARAIGRGVGSGLSAMGKGVASFLGFKLADRGVDISNVNPTVLEPLKGAVAEYKQKTGRDAIITSGYRSPAKQAQLNAGGNKYMTAKPGMSMHQYGWAIDMNSADANRMAELGILDKYGLTQPYPIKDPVHLELAQFNSPQARSRLRSHGGPSQVGDPVPGAYLNKRDLATAAILSERRRADAIAGAVADGIEGTNKEIGNSLKEISSQNSKNIQILNVVSNSLSNMATNSTSPRGGGSALEESLLRGDFPA